MTRAFVTNERRKVDLKQGSSTSRLNKMLKYWNVNIVCHLSKLNQGKTANGEINLENDG